MSACRLLGSDKTPVDGKLEGRYRRSARAPEWQLSQFSCLEAVGQESTPNLPFRRWMDDDAHGWFEAASSAKQHASLGLLS